MGNNSNSADWLALPTSESEASKDVRPETEASTYLSLRCLG